MTCSVQQAGVDTWRLSWYIDEDSNAGHALSQLCDRPSVRGWQMGPKAADHTIGWIPSYRMAWAEGHPSSEDGGLHPGDGLHEAASRVVEGLRDYGVDVAAGRLNRWVARNAGEGDFQPHPGYPTIRRMDVTADLAFGDGAEGLATLAGVAALPLPRIKTQAIYEAGGRRLETVYFRGFAGKKVLGRWYDKGYERSGRDRERGRLIRPEDQRRYTRDSANATHNVDNVSVRAAFVRRFQPLWEATRGIRVSAHTQLAAKVVELRESGALSADMAEKLVGHLLLSQIPGGTGHSRATEYRRRALLRRHGLVLADGVLEEVDIDLGEVLESALDAEAWGVG